MKDTDIVEALRAKLAMPGGRHLYGVLGSYPALDAFAKKLRHAKTTDGSPFPAPRSVNRGILDSIPDEEFRRLTADEAKRPEPTAAHVARAFEAFLRGAFKEQSLVVLAHLEMLFAYRLELNLLRTLSTDEQRLILLLPGRRERSQIVLFPEADGGQYTLPVNLIAENHLWELSHQ